MYIFARRGGLVFSRFAQIHKQISSPSVRHLMTVLEAGRSNPESSGCCCCGDFHIPFRYVRMVREKEEEYYRRMVCWLLFLSPFYNPARVPTTRESPQNSRAREANASSEGVPAKDLVYPKTPTLEESHPNEPRFVRIASTRWWIVGLESRRISNRKYLRRPKPCMPLSIDVS